MPAAMVSRRSFLRTALTAAMGAVIDGRTVDAAPPFSLARRFADLPRHFVFEYYPWYGANPVEHWNQDGRRPPVDLASNYMPKLGAYDSKSLDVLDRHATWIRETGAGAIDVSWWGRGSAIDRLLPTLMDVMKAHDIRVAIHLEPYRDRHADAYADDIEYLIRELGDKRRWDCLLLLKNADGRQGPVFKSFRTIVPPTATDCHGLTTTVPDYADDAVWRSQTDRVRQTFAGSFDHITLLADSLNMVRTKASGFDGVAVYDNYVTPDTWRGHALAASREHLLFSFNVNPGFDGIVKRHVEPGSCYQPPALQPALIGPVTTPSPEEWRRASEHRIDATFATTVALQTDAALFNARRGFFLVYINSFNEWHEGHQFEPMKNRGELTPEERVVGYRNPDDGRYRIKRITRRISEVG
jgi:hypothetical protein